MTEASYAFKLVQSCAIMLKRFSLLLLTTLFFFPAIGFSATIRGQVTSSEFPEGLPGVNVSVYQDSIFTNRGAATDLKGIFIVENIPAGKFQVHFDYIGYKAEIRDVTLQADSSEVSLSVILNSTALSEQTVEVTASVTRHEVSISNTPIRVEVMVPEELQDKIAFSTSVDGALRYSGGIFVNPSKNLYEAENVRLRGMDSRYLLILNDQMPVLGYQPESLGLWTLPLVGVKQLEISKGNFGALYGFGNAGVIHEVMRTPFNDTLSVFGLARSNFEDDHYAGFYAGKRLADWGLSSIVSGENLKDGNEQNNQRIVLLPRLDYRHQGVEAILYGTILNSVLEGNTSLFTRTGISTRLKLPLRSSSQVLLQSQFAHQTIGYLPNPDDYQANSGIYYAAVHYIKESNSSTTIYGVDAYSEDWQMSNAQIDAKADISRLATSLQEEYKLNERWSLMYNGRVTLTGLKSSGPFAFWSSAATPEIGNISTSTLGTDQTVSLLWKPEFYVNYRLSGSYGIVTPFSHYLLQDDTSLHIFVPSNDLNPEQYSSTSFDIKLVKRLGNIGWTGNLSLFATVLKNHIDVYPVTDSSGTAGYLLKNFSGYSIPGLELFSRFDLEMMLLC